MPKTYREAVTEAKVYLESKISGLTESVQKEDVRDILFTSSLFGLSWITDIAFWLQDALQAGNSSRLSTLWPEIRKTLRDIVDAWEVPKGYGEFVKSKNIAMRPIFTRKVSIRGLLEKLSEKIQPQWNKRVSFRLPVSVSSSFPYALRVPTRFISQADEEYTLSLVYIDWNRQPDRTWIDGTKLLARWEDRGELLYHGALEIPSQQLLDRKDSLPYYALLRLKEPGEAFLAKERLVGHSLQLLGPESYQEEYEDLPEEGSPSLLKEATRRRLAAGKPTAIDNEAGPDTLEPPSHLRSRPNEPLSLIPFRVEDIGNPSFSWPTPPAEIKMLETGKAPVITEAVSVAFPMATESTDAVPALQDKPAKLPKPPKPWRMRVRLAPKLMLFMGFFLAASILIVSTFSVLFFRQDASSRVEESNLQVATSAGITVQTALRALEASAITAYSAGLANQQSYELNRFWETNPDMIALVVADANLPVLKNSAQWDGLSLEDSMLEALLLSEAPRFASSAQGKYLLTNASLFFKAPVYVLSLPWENGGRISSLLLISRVGNQIRQALTVSQVNETFVLNERRELVFHPEDAQLFSPQHFVGHPISDRLDTASTDRQNFVYEETGVGPYMASFRLIPAYQMAVVSRVSEARIFEGVRFVEYGNYYFAGALVFFVLFFVLLFSRSITKPLGKLASASEKILKGDYDLDLKPTSKDEVGYLTLRFTEMTKGLAEREKLKDAFGRFVNKEIAELASQGQLKLGGERKKATIFFSDIRGFTAMSESRPPEEVVELLNEYFSRMVGIVFETNGMVDKFIGDAIMATWGVPLSHGNDAENAVNAALKMRQALFELNNARKASGAPEFHIGCGINTGPVLAGQIGSHEKMEYTVIGDAVNLASRIESLNKPMGTDVLISEETYLEVKSIFKVQAMEKITVKGKSDVLQIYAVLGRLDDPHAPVTLDELQVKYGLPSAKGSAQEEEKKYSIQGKDSQ